MKARSAQIHRLRSRILLGAVIAAALSACQAPSASLPAAKAQKHANAINTPSTLRQDTIAGAYEIVASPNGKQVFVAATAEFDATAPGYVHVLDTRRLTETQRIQLPRRAFALALNNRSNTLYVGNTLDGSLSVIDARNGAYLGIIQLGAESKPGDVEHTRKVLVDEDQNRIFVSNPTENGRVWIIDGATQQVQHNVQIPGLWPAGLAYDAQNQRLYVGQGGKDEVIVIDPNSGNIIQTISTGDASTNAREDSRHFFVNIALNEQAQQLYAADANTGKVYVFDVQSGKVVQTVDVGLGLLDIVYSPTRQELITSNRGVSRETPNGTGQITVIDAKTLAIKQRIAAPVHPNSLSLSADGQTLFATIKAPHGDKHAMARKNALDSVMRINLSAL